MRIRRSLVARSGTWEVSRGKVNGEGDSKRVTGGGAGIRGGYLG